MKKRAIRTAATYDEFKNLVACATQKPVERGALTAFSDAKVVVNRVARGGDVAVSATAQAAPSAAAAAALHAGGSGAGRASLPKRGVESLAVPRSAMDFTRDWRRHCTTTDERCAYVCRIPRATLARLFSADLDAELLADIARCFAAKLATPDSSSFCGDAIEVLAALAESSRFALALDLLSRDDVDALHSVVAALAPHVDAEQLARVKRAYRIDV
jgi:hypothetical protein